MSPLRRGSPAVSRWCRSRLLNGWLDLVDGALARELNVASSGGDLLDHVLDRYADIGVIVGLAAGVSRANWASPPSLAS